MRRGFENRDGNQNRKVACFTLEKYWSILLVRLVIADRPVKLKNSFGYLFGSCLSHPSHGVLYAALVDITLMVIERSKFS